MQIVCVEKQRLAFGDVRKNTCNCVEEEQAFFMRCKLMTLSKRTNSCLQLWRELGDLRSAITKNVSQFIVVLFFANPAPERFYERQVRRGGFVFITATRKNPRAIDRGLNRYLSGKPCFACTGFSAQQNSVTTPFARALPQLACFGQFVPAANKASARQRVEERNARSSGAIIAVTLS